MSWRTSFPLLKRIVAGICGLWVCGLVVVVLIQQFRVGVDPLVVVLALILVVPGWLLLWFSATYREYSPEALAANDAVPLPHLSDDALICRFTWLTGRVRAVIVDFSRETIFFHYSHVPRRFLAVTQNEFTCPFSELVAVTRARYRGDSLTISTTTGRATIPGTAAHYEELCARLATCVPADRPTADTDHPWMGFVYAGGAIAGLLASLPFCPRAASTGTLAGCLFLGAGGGLMIVHWGVTLTNRLLRRSVIRPLALGALGALTGLILGGYLSGVLPGNGAWFGLGGVGALVGMIGGACLGPAAGTVATSGKPAADVSRNPTDSSSH